MRKATLVFLFFFLLSSAFALGITPSRTELDYAPGSVKELSYTIRGDVGTEIEVIKQGKLSEYIEVTSPGNFTLDGTGAGRISIKFTMPELSEPGLHEGLIGAQEGIPVGVGGVVARVAVLSQIWVRLPYPEKYLDFWFEAAKQVATDSMMQFVVKMTNRGLTVEHISGAIEIFDSLGNSIAIIPMTTASNLAFGQSSKITADWSTAGVKAGNYRAVTTVNYDEKTKVFEHWFTVGEMRLEIVNVNASQFLKDSIGKIPITVSSKWNDELKGVYATIDISSAGKHITQLQTPTKTVGSWATEKLETYWDTAGLPLGSYTADIIVYYADKTTSTKKQLKIVETLSEETQLAISPDVLMISILVFIVIILAFAYLRKKKKSQDYYNYR